MHKKSTKRAKAPAAMKNLPSKKTPKGGAIERGFQPGGGPAPSGAAKGREKRLMGKRM